MIHDDIIESSNFMKTSAYRESVMRTLYKNFRIRIITRD